MQNKKYRILFGVLLFVLGFFHPDLAAHSTVTGTVTDQGGEPLIGVTIMVKNTGTGSVTDFDGRYDVSASPTDTLVFSYTGYGSQEVVVGNREVIDLELSSEASLLDEVVVVGYGTVRRSDLTGSVASVSGEKLAATPYASAAPAITGRLPGVNVLTTDGSPDAEVVIRVRGGGSITQDNSPLYEVGDPNGIIFRWRGEEGLLSNVLEGISITNTIWGPAWDEAETGNTAVRGIYDGLESTNFNIVNTYATADFAFTEGSEIPGFPSQVYSGTADQLWVAPDDLNFNFQDSGFAGIRDTGDPRCRPF